MRPTGLACALCSDDLLANNRVHMAGYPFGRALQFGGTQTHRVTVRRHARWPVLAVAHLPRTRTAPAYMYPLAPPVAWLVPPRALGMQLRRNSLHYSGSGAIAWLWGVS